MQGDFHDVTFAFVRARLARCDNGTDVEGKPLPVASAPKKTLPPPPPPVPRPPFTQFPSGAETNEETAMVTKRARTGAPPPAQTLVVSARDPAPRQRRGENRPEERRMLILTRLKSAGANIEQAPAGDDSILADLLTLGVVSEAKLTLLRGIAHHVKNDPAPDNSFFSDDTAERDGIVPYFFVREPPGDAEQMERRLAWHATDALTPIFPDLVSILADDAAVCEHAAGLVAGGGDAYALTTHPGHHASRDHYGGYCFLNHAVFIARRLQALGRVPFIVDVDYHGGDGTASLVLNADKAAAGKAAAGTALGFVSLHAPRDYPFLPPGLDWAIDVPPGATWDVYEPLLYTRL